jgi:hypothetical protein
VERSLRRLGDPGRSAERITHISRVASPLAVFGIPAIVAASIALFYALGAPAKLLWPIVVGVCVGTIAWLLYLRAQNLVLYVLVTAASGSLAKGGLGIAIRTHGQLNRTEESNHVAWDILVGGSNTVDIFLIAAGVILFAMVFSLQLFREWAQFLPHASTKPIQETMSTIGKSLSLADHELLQTSRNPIHKIIDLILSYCVAFDELHHATSRDLMLVAMDKWRECHASVWGTNSSRDDTIRFLVDPAKEWLSNNKTAFVQLRDFDLVEESVHMLSGFAVSPLPMAMPDVYSKTHHTEDELWRSWNEQGDRLIALRGVAAQLKELTARAGKKWSPTTMTVQRCQLPNNAMHPSRGSAVS